MGLPFCGLGVPVYLADRQADPVFERMYAI
jgi:hypothetical protein